MILFTSLAAVLALAWALWNHWRVGVLARDLQFLHRSMRARLEALEAAARAEQARREEQRALGEAEKTLPPANGGRVMLAMVKKDE